MRTKYSYEIIGEIIHGKERLKDRCRIILYRYDIGEPLNPLDFAFMLDVLRYHPEYNKKVGVGIAYITPQISGYKHGDRCFEIVRTDGSCEDFSVKYCADGKKMTLKQKIHAACRTAVWDQIWSLKSKAIELITNGDTVICAISGEIITDVDEIHIDHYPMAFKDIVTGFLASLCDAEITEKDIGTDMDGKRLCFTNTDIAAAFSDYHRRILLLNNGLRVTHKTYHLKNSNTGSKRMKNKDTRLHVNNCLTES